MPDFVWFSSMLSVPRVSFRMVRFLMAVLRRSRRICIDTKVPLLSGDLLVQQNVFPSDFPARWRACVGEGNVSCRTLACSFSPRVMKGNLYLVS